MAFLRTVLVVDDDDALRDTLREILEEQDIVTFTAANGQEALAFLRNATELPSMILLDLMMPIMNGWEFRAEQLSEPALAKIPVVVLSASVRVKEDPIPGVEMLHKPVQFDALLDAIERTCRKSISGLE